MTCHALIAVYWFWNLLYINRSVKEEDPPRIEAMSKAYSMEEIRSLYESNPEKLKAEYKASCDATTRLAERARASIAARNYVPKNRVQAYIHEYTKEYIYTNRFNCHTDVQCHNVIFFCMCIVSSLWCTLSF